MIYMTLEGRAEMMVAASCPLIQRLIVPFQEGFVKLFAYNISSGVLSKCLYETPGRIHQVEENGVVY